MGTDRTRTLTPLDAIRALAYFDKSTVPDAYRVALYANEWRRKGSALPAPNWLPTPEDYKSRLAGASKSEKLQCLEMMDAKLAGDGALYLAPGNSTPRFQLQHAAAQFDWFTESIEPMLPWSRRGPDAYARMRESDGRVTWTCQFNTLNSELFLPLFEKWYFKSPYAGWPRYIKRLPDVELPPWKLAVLFADDGSSGDARGVLSIELSIQGVEPASVDRFKSYLENLLRAHVCLIKKGNSAYITMGGPAARAFARVIDPFLSASSPKDKIKWHQDASLLVEPKWVTQPKELAPREDCFSIRDPKTRRDGKTGRRPASCECQGEVTGNRVLSSSERDWVRPIADGSKRLSVSDKRAMEEQNRARCLLVVARAESSSAAVGATGNPLGETSTENTWSQFHLGLRAVEQIVRASDQGNAQSRQIEGRRTRFVELARRAEEEGLGVMELNRLFETEFGATRTTFDADRRALGCQLGRFGLPSKSFKKTAA